MNSPPAVTGSMRLAMLFGSASQFQAPRPRRSALPVDLHAVEDRPDFGSGARGLVLTGPGTDQEEEVSPRHDPNFGGCRVLRAACRQCVVEARVRRRQA